jgi:sugar lactone lactonase YvrE
MLATILLMQSFVFPSGVLITNDGHILVADRGAHRVFRIDPSGTKETIIGNGTAGFSGGWRTGDGRRRELSRMACHGQRRPDPGGSGQSPGPSRRPHHERHYHDRRERRPRPLRRRRSRGAGGDTNPFGLLFDRDGRLLIFDTESHTIRRVDLATGTISTVIGNTRQGFSGDGGPAVDAELYRPHNGVMDAEGRLVFGDSFNQRIRRWDPRTG